MSEISTRILRFTRSDRFEHWLAVISFTTLAVTGLVQKFAETSLAQSIIGILGGVENIRIIHRFAAVLLMFGVVYHIGSLGYKFYVRRVRPTIVPGMRDVNSAWGAFLYNLGRKPSRPQEGRFTFDEKAEYWAFVWGTVIMVITGFMLWNPIATTQILPGQFIPAAKVAHGSEAILAVLAILLWHVYHVHIRHFNRSMFTGRISEHEMVEDHPLELADIKAGEATRPVDPAEVKHRRRIFIPVFGIIGAILLAGIFAFVTFEQTAITTLPPEEQAAIFVPLTPTPLPTPLPTRAVPTPEAITWNAGVGALFETKCSTCHSGSGAMAGLDMSSYEGILEGGNSGPAILPGEADTSLVVMRQSTGNHPGQFTADELALVRDWIAAGAPEE